MLATPISTAEFSDTCAWRLLYGPHKRPPRSCPANGWVVRRALEVGRGLSEEPLGLSGGPLGLSGEPLGLSGEPLGLSGRTSPIKVSCWQPRSAPQNSVTKVHGGFYTAHTRGSLGLSGELSGEPRGLWVNPWGWLYGEPVGLSGEPLKLSGEPLGLSASTFDRV